MKYMYFVFFSCIKDGVRAWGNDQLTMDEPVTLYAHIKLMQAMLAKRYGEANYLIGNYILLREEQQE